MYPPIHRNKCSQNFKQFVPTILPSKCSEHSRLSTNTLKLRSLGMSYVLFPSEYSLWWFFSAPLYVPSFNKGSSSASLMLWLLTPSDSAAPLSTVSSVSQSSSPTSSLKDTQGFLFSCKISTWFFCSFWRMPYFFSFKARLGKLWLTANFLLPCHSLAFPKCVFCFQHPQKSQRHRFR